MKTLNLVKYFFFFLFTILFSLKISAQNKAEWHDVTIKDSVRHRLIPIRIYLPAENSHVPVVLFSHGLGGSREGSVFLAEHWAAHGYICIFVQHPGSDDRVWKEKPILQRMKAMREAANLKNFMLRVKDISAVIDELEKWNKNKEHPLYNRMDLTKIGMSGHSFGAVTTQAVSGQTFQSGISFTDTRIKAAVMFSPSSPKNLTPKKSFSNVKIPWMLMTGTNDVAVIGDQDVKSRLEVFPALPPKDKYEVVLYKAEHSAFTDRALPGDKEKRNPNHHKVILALSTAFWDSYLRNNASVKLWLDGDGPYTILEKEDGWQKK